MQVQSDHYPWNVRALLESTATPFTIADYGPRTAIFRQGDPCDGVMHIEKGRVWLAVTAHSGKEAILGLLEAGAFLGEEALVGCGERRHSATAMNATQVLVVAKAHMIRLLRTQPELLDRFFVHLLARRTSLEETLSEQLLYSTEQRLAHALLVLTQCDERRRRHHALPDLSQEIIAKIVGTTRSRVNILMGQFKRLGFIEENSGVLHVNPGRLDRLGQPARQRRLHQVHDGDRPVSIGAHPAIPPAQESEERHRHLAG
jgi:CRP/FNR family cyclic AMP-dependent transcriptional regulator